MESRNEHEATRRTVIIAGTANILVGLVKLAAGILSGSSAMLAESAHSAADTLDQVFLLMSLRQADRPASREHPFGHGQERYFWSLLAAFGIFVAGEQSDQPFPTMFKGSRSCAAFNRQGLVGLSTRLATVRTGTSGPCSPRSASSSPARDSPSSRAC